MKYLTLIGFILLFITNSCNLNTEKKEMNTEKEKIVKDANIIFLHHSTGEQIVRGGVSKYIYKLTKTGNVAKWFKKYNKQNNTSYIFKDKLFPKLEPYGWKNYPYDYYNIWVKNAGEEPYMSEPTLEMLTKDHDIIIFKHCYPVTRITKDSEPDINSEEKTIENYRLQYEALKQKMLEFKDTKFIVWTGAVLVESATDPEQAQRAKEFFRWVREEWDEEGDNIFLWDFYTLETEGGLYLKPEYAADENNSHVSSGFARKVYPLFCQRVVDVIQGKGDSGDITGRNL